MPFYCLRANKTRDLFHNSRPLASLRLKNTLGGALVGGRGGGEGCYIRNLLYANMQVVYIWSLTLFLICENKKLF